MPEEQEANKWAEMIIYMFVDTTRKPNEDERNALVQEYKDLQKHFTKELQEELIEAKKILKIGLEGIKREFIVAGNTRPYAKEAIKLCNEYCIKAEAFLKE